MKRVQIVCLAMLCSAGTALAQEPPVRPAQDETRQYADYKAREFQENRAALNALSRTPTLEALIQLVRQQSPFQNRRVRGDNADSQQVVKSLLTDTVAYYLASVGMTPADVRNSQKAGLDPVESTIRIIEAQGGAADRAAVSEFVALGEIVQVSDNFTKSLNSTVTVKLERPIKSSNGRQLPAQVQVELDNPLLRIGNGTAAAGQKYLFFLSDSLNSYRKARGLSRGRPQASTYLLQLLPYRVEGDALIPTDNEGLRQLPRESLAQFLQATEALSKGPAAAGSQGGK